MLVSLIAASAAPALAQETDRDPEARGLFLAGQAAFDAGRFEDALRYFEQSYALSSRPALLFNIGQAADRARLDATALDAFRRYLASDPELDAAERHSIEQRVAALEAALRRGAAAEPAETALAPDALPPPPAEPEPSVVPGSAPPREVSGGPVGETALASPREEELAPGPDPAGIALVVAGGLLLVGGGVLAGVGAPDTGALGAPNAGETYPEAQARQDTGSALVGSGLAGLGVGVVLAAIGAAVLASSPAVPAVARVTPTGVEVRF
jgi:tetratricopeptide (TPR) repeat protein